LVENKEGVPLAHGEVLLHTSGSSTSKMVVQSWVPPLICSSYLAVVKSVEAMTPDLQALLSPTWTVAFVAMALGSSLLAMGTTSLCVRAIVLTADGQALRIYPYGRLMGLGLGRGVTIPLKLLRENADFGGAKRDPGSLFIQVRSRGIKGTWSPAHLIVDKPPPGAVPRLPTPGSSLTFTPKGLSPTCASALAAAAEAVGAGGALALATPADKAALKRYILLVWLLQGNCCADMERLRSGDWRQETIGVDLGEAAMGGSTKAGKAYQKSALRAQWKEAVDKVSGRVYYYNVLTWERVWNLPLGVEGAPASIAVGAQQPQTTT
jgi:hypothetical protein